MDNSEFLELVERIKKRRLGSTEISYYTTLYAQAKELDRQRDELKDVIKEQILIGGIGEVVSKEDGIETRRVEHSSCQHMLEMLLFSQTKTNKDKLISRLATLAFGKEGTESRRFRNLLKQCQSDETVVKLNEPKVNPNYKGD